MIKLMNIYFPRSHAEPLSRAPDGNLVEMSHHLPTLFCDTRLESFPSEP